MQAAYVIESLWLERDKAKLSLWIGDRRKVPAVMDAIFGMARRLEFNRLRLLVERGVYLEFMRDYPHDILGREVVLASKL
ncbi:MAG: hypothetical protein NDF55_09890 [archaeon GB-1867-005]|nr:hypothetical protein [Candidatus Culexmicrobium cathedralense]